MPSQQRRNVSASPGAAEERHAAHEDVQREHLGRTLPRRSPASGDVGPKGRRDRRRPPRRPPRRRRAEVGRESVDRERKPGEREEGRERLGQRQARGAEERHRAKRRGLRWPPRACQVTQRGARVVRPPAASRRDSAAPARSTRAITIRPESPPTSSSHSIARQRRGKINSARLDEMREENRADFLARRRLACGVRVS